MLIGVISDTHGRLDPTVEESSRASTASSMRGTWATRPYSLG